MNAKTLIRVLPILALMACKTQHLSTIDNMCSLKFRLTPVSKQLIYHRWTETNISVQNWDQNGNFNDVTNQFMHSDLDDEIVFKKDGTFQFDEGESKARVESAQVYESGYWALYEKEKKLVLCTDGHNTIYEIVEISHSSLILQIQKSSAGKKYTYTLSYSPK